MILISALSVKNAFFIILYSALWIRSACFNDFNKCTLSKERVLYSFYIALWIRSACYNDFSKCTFSKERVLLQICKERFELEAHVLIILISELSVKNAFFTILYSELWIRSACINDFNKCTISKERVLLQFCTVRFE